METKENMPQAPVVKLSPGYVETIALVLIIVAAALFCYDRHCMPKVKVADLRGYVERQKALLASGNLSEEHWQQSLDTMDQLLDQEPRHHLIILKDVVLRHDPKAEIELK